MKKDPKRNKGAERSSDKPGKKAAADEFRLSTLLGPKSLLDLDSESKEDLLRVLAETVALEHGYPSAEQIFNSAMERESVVNTYLGHGVAVPHSRVSSFEGFAIAIARNPTGFPYGVETDEPVRIVILVVGNETRRNEHVRLLASLASALQDETVRSEILDAKDAAAVRRILDRGAPGPRRRPQQLTKLLLSHARRIAKDIGATAVIVAIESPEELTILKRLPRKRTFVVATSSSRIADMAEKIVERVIRLPRTPFRHNTLVRVGTLLGVSKGFISRDDVVAFLSGQGNGLNTFTVLSVSREFGRILTASGELSRDMSADVFERVLSLASELAREGREGRPVGTIFVIGDPQRLKRHCQQLVINPFHGYPESERNILDPTLGETIKEFATIDGAFIIGGDGVIHSAGTYLRPGDVDVELPSGYGTRHWAAAAITAVAPCVSAVISESTGRIVFFKKGLPIFTAARPES